MKKIVQIIIIISLFIVSCTKGFEEMNVNPITPTGTDIPKLFNGVIKSLILGWNEQFYLNNEIFYPETELGALTTKSWNNYTIGTEEVWTNYYSALSSIRDIDSRLKEKCEEKGDEHIGDLVKAQVIVLKAYKTFKVTDLFGDIPYFNAGMIWEEADNQDYRKAKFDKQEEIYKTLLNELVWARNTLEDAGETTPDGNEYYKITAGADPLFGNNYTRWAKFANALILRNGLRMYDKDTEFASPLLVEAFEKPDFNAYEDICLWPQYLNWQNTAINWAFREHNNLRMGTTVWANMHSPNFTFINEDGIFDYRAFIFYDTSNKDSEHPQGTWNPFPQIKDENTIPEKGSPYTDGRLNNFWFKPECLYSPFNFYMVRDENYIPEVLFSACEYNLIRAEIMARGIVSGGIIDVGQLFEKGIKNSFFFWNQMPKNSSIWTEYHTPYANIIDQGEDQKAQQMMANVINFYMSSDTPLTTMETYLKAIIAQRWINYYKQPWEAWALARRTLQTPTTINHENLKTKRLTYPPSEVTYNRENYSAQVSTMSNGDSKETPMWWMTIDF